MEAVATTRKILEYMNFLGADIQAHEERGRLKVRVQVEGGRDLIGERGLTLACLQHIVRRIAVKKDLASSFVDIDVNGYKQIREQVLSDFARDIGERVRLQGRPIELEPMPPFDRRVIHLALGIYPDLTTESIGEGESRYIVVRPHP